MADTPWWHDVVPWMRLRTPAFRARLALLRMVPRVDPRLSAAIAALVVVNAVSLTGFTLATAGLVEALTDGGRRVLPALAVMSALFVVPAILSPVLNALLESLRRRVDTHVRERVMEAMLRPTGVAHLEDPEMADLVRDARGVGTAQHTPGRAIVGFTFRLSRRLESLGAAILLGLYFNWFVALSLVAIGFVARTIALRQTGETASVIHGGSSLLRRSDYLRDLALTPGPAKEVRVFGLTGWIVDRFATTWSAAMQPAWELRRRSGRGTMAFAALVYVVPGVGALLLAARAAAAGDLSLGALAIVLQAAMTAPMADVQGWDWDIDLGARAVPSVLALESATSASPGRRRDPQGMPARSVRFEGVTFRYPGSEVDVLRGLDLDIPAGRSLAIVGDNGAGKTTIVKLLARLYDPVDGRISVDDVDLRYLDAAAWQRRVGAIFQDFVRYELPVRDNVGFGAHERIADDAALDRSAARAGAEGIVEQHGWDTILSREYSGGAEISGGQWQRIALARALFAVDAGAGVLVLDEPTANLDVRAEAELYERFLELTHGVTTVLVSHRFSTVRRADAICVIDGGRVAERGTHDELMAIGGRYARMFGLQAARFHA